MAEETQTKAVESAPAAEVVAVEAVEKEKVAVTEAPPPPPPEAAEEAPPAPVPEDKKPEGEEAAAATVPKSASFKEESNVVGDLEDPEKKALDELKQLVQAALANNEFNPPPPPPPPAAPEEAKAEGPSAPAPAEEPAPPGKPESDETPKPVEAEPPKPAEPEETQKLAEPEETQKPAEAEEPLKAVVVEETPPPEEEKAVVVDEDGAKTVEAIQQTVVPVAAPAGEEVILAAPAEAAVEPEKEASGEAPAEEVFIWGVPLVGDEKSDTVLLKFLRAREFKVKEAMAMIKNAVIWRKQFGIDGLLEEDLGLPEMEKVVFMHGFDKEGHPVCYNVYGEFQNKELYAKAFDDEEKRQRFLKWRIQYLEKGIRNQLDFTPGGICSMVQVTDLKNSPKLGKHRQATKQALTMLQDNYPEFIAKKIFINVPWWYLAFNRMISPFFTQRTRSKFVFAGPSKSAETLFKYIAPEQVPVQYGGLSKDNDPDFTTADAVTEVTIKPSSKQTVEIPVSEICLLVWELRVLGWEVSYGAEFVPSAENSYTVIVQKMWKLAATDEPVMKASFKVGEPGKVVLTIDNPTSKKKKLLYRSKATSSSESK